MFENKAVTNEFRVFYINCTGKASRKHFPTNQVVTSRYTVITFLPKNLFEQFRRLANLYFLVFALVQLVGESPVPPSTTIAPLTLVLLCTACKQAYEDYQRHKSDQQVNNTPVTVIRNKKIKVLRSREIKVGDIVKVHKNEPFPCDLIMLSSADNSGDCAVTTANLDGETNLKTLSSLKCTKHLTTSAKLANDLEACVQCDLPNPNLYAFKGTITMRNKYTMMNSESTSAISVNNILLCGAILKNTDYVYGCAVYTGKETKVKENSKKKITKKSVVETKLDRFIAIFVIVLLVESCYCGLMWTMYSKYDENYKSAWYIVNKNKETTFTSIFDYLILFNYIIPISLYVTIEMQKIVSLKFFNMDVDIQYEDKQTGETLSAIANTSDLNEELGQVEYIFTDKTGTLTENKMTFRQCFVSGNYYADIDGHLWDVNKTQGLTVKEKLIYSEDDKFFFQILSLCHTSRIENHSYLKELEEGSTYNSTAALSYIYEASSPDEKALVEATRNYGIIYHGITKLNNLVLTINDKIHKYKLLKVLEFDSDRKRMSVIVQPLSTGKYLLLCKGADSGIIHKCRKNKDTLEQIIEATNYFALYGLRVLVIAYKELTEQEYQKFHNEWISAENDLTKGEWRRTALMNKMESNLVPLGCTAVEDELQTGVVETLVDLRLAGIQIWVLTGDKVETAINISLSAGHFHSNTQILKITGASSIEECKDIMKELMSTIDESASEAQHGLVVDGTSLTPLLSEITSEVTKMFLQLCKRCSAVLCCRCTPLQKSRVVALVKQGIFPSPVTLAIGDGANDVSMIREAHIGIGLFGKEGRSAALNSDYAFARFQFLRKALLFHGHYFYKRLSILVLYFFYKNIIIISASFCFSYSTFFSGSTPYEYLIFISYNLFMTSLPIIMYGLFEKHIDGEKLLNDPQIYKQISKNHILSWKNFTIWISFGLWHAFWCYFCAYIIFANNDILGNGETYSNVDFGMLIVLSQMVVVNLKLVLETYYFCWPVAIGFIVTFGGCTVLFVIYCISFDVIKVVQISFSKPDYSLFYSYFNVLSEPSCWLIIIVTVAICITPDIIYRTIIDIRLDRQMRTSILNKKEKQSATRMALIT